MRAASLIIKSLGVIGLGVLSCIMAAPVEPGTTRLETRSETPSSKVNDWSCKPSTEKPYPLILIHGAFFPAEINWIYHGPRFIEKGYCVFQLTYGIVKELPTLPGVAAIEASAAELSEFVDRVLAATGTAKVDMLGHSEGGLMPLYYLKRLGGAAKVHKIAAFAPITHGSNLSGLEDLARTLQLLVPILKIANLNWKSVVQMTYDSAFLEDLHKDGDTSPGVQYFYLASKYDEVVTPYTNSFLRQTNANVTNAVLQDYCDTDRSEHLLFAVDGLAFNIVENFFSPPSTPRTLDCSTT
ncbi:hypothetical protein BGZ72_004089 [Mortierella alpina]|nr:hypothetical protein BGZ72_004089 [Mortierella alpina]